MRFRRRGARRCGSGTADSRSPGSRTAAGGSPGRSVAHAGPSCRADGGSRRTIQPLRHYGNLAPAVPYRFERYYDSAALLRLQRILVLRSLGLPLPAIREAIDGTAPDIASNPAAAVLRSHLNHLRGEQRPLGRRINAVLTTVEALERGEEPMPEKMFDGFDSTRYRDEVAERWGRDAYTQGDAWWRGKTDDEKEAFARTAADLTRAWTNAASRGAAPAGEEAQELARQHIDWLSGIPGVPRDEDGSPSADYIRGLGEMYVTDPRFAANYGGRGGAELVRAALDERLSRSS